MDSGSFKNIYKLLLYKSYINKLDLALNNPQGLICQKALTTENHLYLIGVLDAIYSKLFILEIV